MFCTLHCISFALSILQIANKNRNSSSRIDVDNYDNLQTLYTNIKINYIHIAMAHPQTTINQHIHVAHSVCVVGLMFFCCCCLAAIVLVVCIYIAVKFPVFYSFSRAHTERAWGVGGRHTVWARAHIMCCIRWLIVDACVANILCLPFNSLVKVQKATVQKL